MTTCSGLFSSPTSTGSVRERTGLRPRCLRASSACVTGAKFSPRSPQTLLQAEHGLPRAFTLLKVRSLFTPKPAPWYRPGSPRETHRGPGHGSSFQKSPTGRPLPTTQVLQGQLERGSGDGRQALHGCIALHSAVSKCQRPVGLYRWLRTPGNVLPLR